MSAPSSTVPRWKTAIEGAIAKYKNQTVIQIATADDTRTTPRVRSHIFRSFLSYPAHPNLPLLLSSTDIRSPKVSQVTSPNNKNSSKVELVWWIDGTQQQFRILADEYILPTPEHPLHTYFKQRLEEKSEIGEDGRSPLALFPSLTEWESRRTDSFESMSAHMKASWCRPTPGTPLALSGGPEAAKKWPERVVQPDKEKMDQEEYEEAKKNWEQALSNFALVVIDPYEVDFVDLSGTPDKRWSFVKRKEANKWVWEEEELVP